MKFKLGLFALLFAGSALAQTQGVSKNEIVIGTIQDLSGPVVSYSKPVVAGMRMRVDEINAEGGIHGRKLKLVVEDSGYDPKKAVLAQQKIIERDKAFAMLGTLGTPVVAATMPLVLDKKMNHLFPLTGAAFTYEPVQKYKFQVFAPYTDTVRAALRHMIKTKGFKKVGILYQDDDFGLEVLRGAEAGAKDMGQALCEKTTYKRGATDFSSQIQRLQSAGCDFVVLGTIVRETVGSIATARKLGWNVEMMGSSAAYDNNIPKFGQKAVEGFYAISVQAEPPVYATANARLKQWIDAYKKAFNEDPTLNAALEGLVVPRDYFGAPEYSFSKTNHLGNKRGKIAQIQNGNWVTLTDFLD